MARILVADDEADIRDIATRALESMGHEVTAVADGGAALATLNSDSAYDLLLTDIAMPVMDGIALALKVSSDYPNVRILLMTGYGVERQRAYGLTDLVHVVLDKPFGLEALKVAIAQTLT